MVQRIDVLAPPVSQRNLCQSHQKGQNLPAENHRVQSQSHTALVAPARGQGQRSGGQGLKRGDLSTEAQKVNPQPKCRS